MIQTTSTALTSWDPTARVGDATCNRDNHHQLDLAVLLLQGFFLLCLVSCGSNFGSPGHISIADKALGCKDMTSSFPVELVRGWQ